MESSQLKRISIIGLSILCLSPIEIFSNKLFESKRETTVTIALEPVYLSNNYEIFNPNIKTTSEELSKLVSENKKEENSDSENNLESETTIEEEEEQVTEEIEVVESYTEEQYSTSTTIVPEVVEYEPVVQEDVQVNETTIVTESSSTNVPEPNTEVATSLVNFAMQFVGYPYRSGGTDLYSGVDCSGFTMKVFEQFGYSLPHSAASQSAYGSYVSLDNLRAGDLIFYGYSGYISHVAIYIGNGQIVHAATSDTGIRTASYTMMPIITARRILN